MAEIEITRRHLPHWVLDGSVYFVTSRAYRTVFNEDEQRIIRDHIKDGDGKYYDCYAAIVMPDHLHILFRPKEGYTLRRIMQGIKGASAYKVNQSRNTKGRIWQDESFDRIVRDEKEFEETLNYMLNNPLKKGLTDDPWNYVGWYYNEEMNR